MRKRTPFDALSGNMAFPLSQGETREDKMNAQFRAQAFFVVVFFTYAV